MLVLHQIEFQGAGSMVPSWEGTVSPVPFGTAPDAGFSLWGLD